MSKRKRYNMTAYRMMTGQMRFRRRVDIPMWHLKHVEKCANILEEYAQQIRNVSASNTLRSSEKTMHCQMLIQQMNSDFQRMTPLDPRERGAEQLEYVNGMGLINKNGFDKLLARDDMDD